MLSSEEDVLHPPVFKFFDDSACCFIQHGYIVHSWVAFSLCNRFFAGGFDFCRSHIEKSLFLFTVNHGSAPLPLPAGWSR